MMPMYHGHILGFVVRHLREMYLAGGSAESMMAYLTNGLSDDLFHASRYMGDAFCQKTNVFTYILPPGPTDEKTEQAVRKYIEKTREEWASQRFPELLRVRDYFSFLEFARDEQVNVIVCDAPPTSDHYQLHGIYDADSGEPVWSGRRGEKFRAAINRRLGREMVRSGPLDDWERRREPRLPAICFEHDQYIRNYLEVGDLACNSPASKHWSRIYPDHPVQP
jgi:hypothetical protein